MSRLDLGLLICAAFMPSVAWAGDVGCNRLPALRSETGDRSSTMTFVNASGEVRRIVWIGYDGGPVLYNTLAPGQTALQPTFATHVWLITNAAGACTEIFVARGTNRTVQLQ